jgi:hypothetical protein
MPNLDQTDNAASLVDFHAPLDCLLKDRKVRGHFSHVGYLHDGSVSQHQAVSRDPRNGLWGVQDLRGTFPAKEERAVDDSESGDAHKNNSKSNQGDDKPSMHCPLHFLGEWYIQILVLTTNADQSWGFQPWCT